MAKRRKMMLKKYVPFLTVSLLLCLALVPAYADDRGTWSFNWENDIYGGTDRNYSNGVRLSYVSPAVTEEGFHRWLADTIIGLEDGDSVRYGFAVGHSIFTPEDTETAAPLPDQHPYA